MPATPTRPADSAVPAENTQRTDAADYERHRARIAANLARPVRLDRVDADQCIVCGATLGCDCARVPNAFAWWR